jgi:hypothetical protein
VSTADDGFLSRWARRKAQVRSGVAEPAGGPAPAAPREAPTLPAIGSTANPGVATAVSAPVVPVAATVPLTPVLPVAAPAHAASPPSVEPPALPTLEDVALLTRSSDYSRFVQPGVDSGVKNAALKKLFSDPHFNVMDGLDTYIDDYGKPDPIPLSMLRQMNQAKFLGLFDDEEEKDAAADAVLPPVAPDGAPSLAVAESESQPSTGSPAREPEALPDDDADLRLQQDDGARRSGAEPGPRA